jgi:hypothetical protein
LVEEKYLGAAIWVRRPTESALNILVISLPPCEFHVCKRLWVVMVLGLLVVWICCVFRFPQVVAGHRMVGRCLGRMVG